MPDPIYTADNVQVAYELRWSIAAFWTVPAPDPNSWLSQLKDGTERDGVRVLEHRLTKNNVSQFLVSTKPHVTPSQCLRSIKGRLQYLVRATLPKAFRRNYGICSLGSANQEVIEQYVASQLRHHPMPDPRIETLLKPYQFVDDALDLACTRRSSHGEFIYNLHLVAVHQERFIEVRDDYLRRSFDMLRGTARKKNHLLSRIGLLADHVHWTIGCGIDDSPLAVGLSYLNNLAYAQQMRPVFQFSFYVGTFGPYDMGAIRRRRADDNDSSRTDGGGSEGGC